MQNSINLPKIIGFYLLLFHIANVEAQVSIFGTDYDIDCNHPMVMEEFYSHNDVYNPPATLPLPIPSNGLGLQQNIFIPFNVDCGPQGEEIQAIEFLLELSHNDFSDLELYLHVPTAMNLSPISLANSGQLTTSNFYQASSIPELQNLMRSPLSPTESPSHDLEIITTAGNQLPTNFGSNWYFQIVDSNSPINNPAYGGMVLTNVSMTISAGFPFPYTTAGCCVQSVTLLSESFIDYDCNYNDFIASDIRRLWQVTDDNGQNSTSYQTVHLKAPLLEELFIPKDITIECIGQDLDDILPVVSGKPMFNCFDIELSQNSACDISYTYEDNVFNLCPNSYVILRQWIAINWCIGHTYYQTQVITFKDTQGPDIQENLMIQTTNCSEVVNLSNLVNPDACSGLMTATASYVAGGGIYDANSPDLVTIDLMTPVSAIFETGITEVYITARDSCLNDSEQLVVISILDNTPPSIICVNGLVTNGINFIELLATDFVETASDDCSSEAELMASAKIRISGTTMPFQSTMIFECIESSNTILVDVQVSDESGNTAECSTYAVLDNLPMCCPSTLQVNDTPIMDDTYISDESLTSQGTVPANGNVIFKAGQTICLDEDFKVELGGSFETIIEGCLTNFTEQIERE